MTSPSLNGPCPCGSGKKYKRCCGVSTAGKQSPSDDRHAHFQVEMTSGMAAQRCGNFESAAVHYERALSLYPDDPGVLGLIAMTRQALGQHDLARDFVSRAIALQPNEPHLQELLGRILLSTNDLLNAERAFGQAVSLSPQFLDAWKGLGLALYSRNRLVDARMALSRALQLMPDDGDAQYTLAQTCYLMEDMDAAEAALHAIRQRGDLAGKVPNLLGMILRDRGDTEGAEDLFAKARAYSWQPEEWFQELLALGVLETKLGHFAAAETWLRQAMELDPVSPLPYVALSATHKFTPDDLPLLDKMEACLFDSVGLDRRGLEFSLGKVCADLKEFDRAFAHYKAGNDLVRSAIPFNPEAYIAEVDSIIQAMTQERLALLPNGSDSSLPILIVGTPRSGTTLTEQIISSHSLVGAAGEVDFWSRLGLKLARAYDENSARELAQGYLANLQQYSPASQRITDKMPGNYKYLGLLHAVLPNAKIVHCQRHPIDACLSIYFQNLTDGHDYKWDLDGLAVYYEQYQRLMAHWREVLPPGAMYELRYEDLVEDVEGESRRLMAFLGLEWEPGQMDFHKGERAVFTASTWQARQPIYKSSKERWRVYEKYLGPLMGLLQYESSPHRR